MTHEAFVLLLLSVITYAMLLIKLFIMWEALCLLIKANDWLKRKLKNDP